ncbi:hypothetical protein [Bradyrhizobium sp. WSM1253]|uniref:hypothetical protein n=1 Tax=Bradyrhizobium sp. WSM1253 TaxID=319003 RepID=UPI00025D3041|nr:hypothetical protein [Bradyrhizobium sp. WSM1253]EIG62805.1 hypothetical protein Bra1253DRAFT_07741 [Bradyrhizobium sp. WSM1253]
MTGGERARRFREKRSVVAAPTNAQFDRELRLVVIEHVANESMTPAKALVLVRERLAKRFSVEGINRVIAAYGDRS